jgi:hypothetical protein
MGPALSLIDVVLLVAGGFVVISAVGVPLVALPLVSSFTAGLESPRREAVTVVINYSVMALPSLFILWRQLKALPRAQAPKGGWLQWRWQPWPGVDLVSRWRLVDGDACSGGNGLAVGSLGWRPRWQQPSIGARFG